MGITEGQGMTWLGVRGYVAAVTLIAVAATGALATVDGMGSQRALPEALAFAIAFVVVQLLPIPVPRGSQTEVVRIEEALVVPMVLVLQPALAVLTIGAGMLAGLLISRASALKIIFNVAQMMAATAACAAIVHAAVGSLPQPTAAAMASAVVGLVAMFAVNQLFMAGIMNRAGAVPLRAAVLDGLGLKAAMWVANAAIGLMLVLPVFHAPLLTLAALVPLAFLHVAYRTSAVHARDVQRLGDLNAATGGMAGEVRPDPIARQLAMSAREVVGASGAEVTLFVIGRSFIISRDGDDLHTSEREVGEHQQLDSSIGQASFVVPLVASTGPIGELRVWHERVGSARENQLFPPRPNAARDACPTGLNLTRQCSTLGPGRQSAAHDRAGFRALVRGNVGARRGRPRARLEPCHAAHLGLPRARCHRLAHLTAVARAGPHLRGRGRRHHRRSDLDRRWQPSPGARVICTD